MSVFLIVHVLLHRLFSSHEQYAFEGMLCFSLIWGAAAFGALHLMLSWRSRHN